jgi:hypothetical protein
VGNGVRARGVDEPVSFIVHETVHDFDSDCVLVVANEVRSLVASPLDLRVRVGEAPIPGSKKTLREAPVTDEDRPSDPVAVPTVSLAVATEEGVGDAVSGSHNWTETSETSGSVTGIGACTATATSGAPFTYKDAVVNATLLFAATDGVNALLFAHMISGRAKRHW